MNITKNQPDALNYQVTIEITPDDYAEALKKRLNEYRRRADIKGFRKGMAPMSLIQRLYGDQSLYEAVNRLVSEQLDNFIRDEKIRVVGEPLPSEDQPQLEWKPGSDFTFKFDIAQTPELNFEVGEGDKIPYYEINVTEEAKKAMKAQMLQQYGARTTTSLPISRMTVTALKACTCPLPMSPRSPVRCLWAKRPGTSSPAT